MTLPYAVNIHIKCIESVGENQGGNNFAMSKFVSQAPCTGMIFKANHTRSQNTAMNYHGSFHAS